MKILLFYPERCTGCRSCEVACSYKHEGLFIPSLARIHITSLTKEGIHFQTACTQCEDAPCENVCPVSAIVRDPETSSWIVKEERCIGCKLCMFACPVGAISFHPLKRVAIKCDLCGGSPECVSVCPTSAIEFVDEEEAGRRKARYFAEPYIKIYAGREGA